MKPFENISSNMAPLDVPNVDTDQIIPKQFLKRVERTGFGQYLFFDWRFLDSGEENAEFSLNQSSCKDSEILLASDNFGCGSSREHAPWALLDYGFKAIIAPGYADIFYNNCFQNGILPIVLAKDTVVQLFEKVERAPEKKYLIDLENQKIISDNAEIAFTISAEKKEKLLKGLDDIAITLQFTDEISDYEKRVKVPMA